MADPVTTGGEQDNTPVATKGFGARESADETRQAQQQVANDAPVDVNPNAIIAREQGATMVLMGKNFEAAATRRNLLFDHVAALLGIESAKAVKGA